MPNERKSGQSRPMTAGPTEPKGASRFQLRRNYQHDSRQDLRDTSRCFLSGLVAFCLATKAMAPDVAKPNEASLGTVDFPISCSAAIQPQFNRAVAWLHHM